MEVKVKVNVDLYSASSWKHLLRRARTPLKYGMHSQGSSQFYMHTPRSSANGMNRTCLKVIDWLIDCPVDFFSFVSVAFWFHCPLRIVASWQFADTRPPLLSAPPSLVNRRSYTPSTDVTADFCAINFGSQGHEVKVICAHCCSIHNDN